MSVVSYFGFTFAFCYFVLVRVVFLRWFGVLRMACLVDFCLSFLCWALFFSLVLAVGFALLCCFSCFPGGFL